MGARADIPRCRPNGGACARLIAGLAIGLLAVAPAHAADAPAPAPLIARVIIPQPDGPAKVVDAPAPDPDHPGWIYGPAGEIVQLGGTALGDGSASATHVSLFHGRVTADAATARLDDTGAPQVTLDGLALYGTATDATPGATFQLSTWGRATVLGSAAAADGRGATATALRIDVMRPHGGLPAGSVILVGRAEAAPPPDPGHGGGTLPGGQGTHHGSGGIHPQGGDQGGGTHGGGTRPAHPVVHHGSRQAKHHHAAVRPAPRVHVHLSPGRYVFPVAAPADFTDSFGAPRADTIWHHGVDIFSRCGAPLVAVTDSMVYMVGWNTLGGNRLWLRDADGNEFYYAHLRDYAPAAVSGHHVKAGTVLGFMGNTGDAEGTPCHLHFELHPKGLLWQGYDGVIDPYRYLLAWQAAHDLRITVPAVGAHPATTLGGPVVPAPAGPAALPGIAHVAAPAATLVVARPPALRLGGGSSGGHARHGDLQVARENDLADLEPVTESG